MVELVDTLVLGTSAARREGSSPFIPTSTDALASAGLSVLKRSLKLQKESKANGKVNPARKAGALSFHPASISV